jgi:hypothetical protein
VGRVWTIPSLVLLLCFALVTMTLLRRKGNIFHVSVNLMRWQITERRERQVHLLRSLLWQSRVSSEVRGVLCLCVHELNCSVTDVYAENAV